MQQDYTIPLWLDNSYLLKVLKSSSNMEIVLNRFHVESATNKGDNYASEMFRITLEYWENGVARKQRMILKKDHESADLQEIFNPHDLYKTEIDCYRFYIPEFEKILQAAGETVKFSPKLIYHHDPVFIMEDATELHYQPGSRSDRFDARTSKVFLAKLARFHAASMVYNRNTGGGLETKSRYIFDVGQDAGFMKIMDSKFELYLKEMETWGPEIEALLPKLRKLRKNFITIAKRTALATPGMGVLVHGDAWLSNILVKFENQVPVDAFLIDLQCVAWASPAVDLLYHCYTSLNEEDYQLHLDEFVKYYYDELSGVLRKLNYSPIPSLHALQLEIESKYFHAFYAGVMVKSIIYAEDSSSLDVETSLSHTAPLSPRLRNEIQYLIKLLDGKGVLDLEA